MQIICDYIRPSSWEVGTKTEKKKRSKENANAKKSYLAASHIARVLWMDIIYDVFDIGKAWFVENIQNTCTARRTKPQTRRIAFRSGLFMNWIIFFVVHNSPFPLFAEWIENAFKVARFKRGLKWTWVYNKKILKRRSFDLRIS